MKMWKVAAIATLLLVPSTFGAVVVHGTPGPITAKPGDTVTAPVWLQVTGPDAVNATSLFLESNKPGALAATGRAFGETIMASWVTANATTWKNGALDNADPKDSGLYNADGEDEAPGVDKLLVTFTLQISPSAAFTQADPLKLQLRQGVWSNSDASLSGSFAGHMVLLTITPEPASMMLLAAGAAFFARRRKA